MKNSQQSLELTVLHIIKNEEKAVDSNSLGIVGGEGLQNCRICSFFTSYIYVTLDFDTIIMYYLSNQEKNPQEKKCLLKDPFTLFQLSR